MQAGPGMAAHSISSRGRLKSTEQVTDAAPPPLTIVTGMNDALKIFVDGSPAETISIAAGDYAAVEDLIEAINAAITAKVNLKGKVTADVNEKGEVFFQRTATGPGASIVLIQRNGALVNPSINPRMATGTGGLTPTFAEVTGKATPAALTIVTGMNDALKIFVDGSPAETISIAAGDYAAVEDLIEAINAAITANVNLKGKVTAVNEGGKVSFRTTDAGSGASITLMEGNGALAHLNIGTEIPDAGGLAHESDQLHALGLVSGDTPPPSTTSGKQRGRGGEGERLPPAPSGFLSLSPSLLSGLTASPGEDGKIILKDETAEDALTRISLSTAPGSGGTITLPSFSNRVAGGDTGIHSASIFVYDSLGNKHHVEISFIKSSAPGTRDWTVTIDGGRISPMCGGSGRVTFNNDGSLAAFTSSDNAPLRFSPSEGEESISITLNGGRSGGFEKHPDTFGLDLPGKEPSSLSSAEPKSAIRNPQSAINMEIHSEARENNTLTDKATLREHSGKYRGRALSITSSRRPDQRAGMEENRSELPKPSALLSEPSVHKEVYQPSFSKGSHEIPRDRPEIVDRIVRHVVTSIKEGRSEMHIRIDPEHLGTLRLKLILDDTTVTVRLQVERESTRALIESHLPKLRASLEEQGLSVEKFDVLVQHEAPDSSDRQEAPLHRERTGFPYYRGLKNSLVKSEEADGSTHRLHRSFGYNTMEWTA